MSQTPQTPKTTFSLAPSIHPLDENIPFPKVLKTTLSNGVSVDVVQCCDTEFLRFDIVFGCGSNMQTHFFIASFTKILMSEGTTHYSSREIAELFDFYGVVYSASVQAERTIFTVLVLRRFLPQISNVLREILTEPVFSEKEFELQKEKAKQEFSVSESTVHRMAYRAFQRTLYGEEGTLGKTPVVQDYDRLQLDWIKEFHKRCFVFNNCRIFLSGNIKEEDLKTVDQCLGSVALVQDYTPLTYDYVEKPSEKKKIFVEKSDSVQSAIMVGRKLFDIRHSDRLNFSVLNTVFGGYFGSRLMSNIREEKGYTYGINSSVSEQHKVYLSIVSTQTANQYVQPLLKELYGEMDRLCNEVISEDELAQVRNIMIGDLLRTFDGSFSVVDLYISLTLKGFDYKEYITDKLECIKKISAQTLLETAQKYLVKYTYYEVVAGALNQR